jgi:hypothetical protein
MAFSTGARLTAKTPAVVLCMAFAILVVASAGSALATTAIHFQPESLTVLEGQLGHHEVHALTFHEATGTGHIHASLNDGRRVTVVYSTSEQARLLALARADGTPVAVAAVKPKHATTTVHHKLRYIAGGILVVVIIVVVGVLLIDRRRKLGEGAEGHAAEGHDAEGAPGQSPPSDPT